MAILSNQVECLKCGDRPFSAHRHDFSYCECGAVAVDGGMDYLRRLGLPEDYKELSITMSDEACIELQGELEDTTKNSLGKLCNVLRYMRDEMDIDPETFQQEGN